MNSNFTPGSVLFLALVFLPVLVALKNRVSLVQLLRVALYCVVPSMVPKAYCLIYESVVNRGGQQNHGDRFQQAEEEFDATTSSERYTFAGGFRGIGAFHWFMIGGFIWMNYSHLKTEDPVGVLALVAAATILMMAMRAGITTFSSLRAAFSFGTAGNAIFVLLFHYFMAAILFFVELVGGLVIAPLHAVTFAFKWSRFLGKVSRALNE